MPRVIRGLALGLLGAGLLLAGSLEPGRAGTPDECGNGTTVRPELCDDGNTTSGDGCSTNCLPEVCGDDILNPEPAPGPAEECDDGNTAPNDGCDPSCKLECGNGTLEGAEACDDGGESATCDDDCTAVACGDGNVNETAGELCDPPGPTCFGDCTNGEPAPKGEQACINAVNGNALGVLKALDKALGRCWKDAAAGKTGVGACLAGLGAATANAEGKTTATASRKCAGANQPSLVFTDAATVNAGAKSAGLGSATTVLGAAPSIASKSADGDGARCQGEVWKRVAKLQETWMAEANEAKKTALRAGASSNALVAAAIETALTGNARVASAAGRLTDGVAKEVRRPGRRRRALRLRQHSRRDDPRHLRVPGGPAGRLPRHRGERRPGARLPGGRVAEPGRMGGRPHLFLALALGLSPALLAVRGHAGIPEPVCGDGVAEAYELCDDGNTTSGDGCSFPSCRPELCGDSIVNFDPPPGPAEECDDGNTAPNDGCDAGCKLECGNGTIEGAEACDDGGESATCDDDCTAVACGDGFINETAGEECEDGNAVNGDGCSSCRNDCLPNEPGPISCVVALSRRLAGVVRARSGDDARCLRRAAAGRTPLSACVGRDLRDRVQAAQRKTYAADAKLCAQPNTPLFAYTGNATVNSAGEAAAAEAFAALLGAAPNVAPRRSDPDAARCQIEVIERHEALLAAALAEVANATREALRGSRVREPICSELELGDVLALTLAASPKVEKAADALRRAVVRRCAGVDVDALFECAGATTTDALVSCVRETALRAACEAIERADGLRLDCPGDV